MFARPHSALLFLLCGCTQAPGKPLSRLTQAWAVDTAEQAAAPIAGTLVLGAFAAHICTIRVAEELVPLSVDEAFPLPDSLVAVLGAPTVSRAQHATRWHVRPRLGACTCHLK